MSFATACDDAPRSQDDTGGVESPPPESAAGQGDPIVDRDLMAREAFDRWAPLVTSGRIDEARALCEAWLGTPDYGQHAEAHKCLANVTIASSRAEAKEMAVGAGVSVPPISGEGVAKALEHYDLALATAPLDLDAHIGRVDLLIVAGRYREANARLDESLGKLPSPDRLDDWFKLLGRFQRAGAAQEGLAFLQVIERHHPRDHRVESNLGAFYAMTGNDDEAQAHLERAVSIDPDDPYDHWNLARVYDKRGRLQDADRHYREALAVMGSDDARARCDYAKFIATRLEDTGRACDYAKSRCVELYERNCTGGAAGSEHAGQAGPPAA